MRGAAVLGAALIVAACGRDAPPASPAPAASAAPTTEPSPARLVASLAGEWRVAGIDGKPFDEPYGLALAGDARAVWWQPRCAGVVRGYTIAGERIAVGPDPDLPPRQAGGSTLPVCAIGLPPRLGEVTRALDTATTIRRTPNNGIELSGGGHSLLLFSQ